MESLAIISCVAAVISAYHNGSAIIRRIKAKREARRALPPLAELEKSLDLAPEEIEAEKQKGVARFGRDFEHGDVVAIFAIQQVTIDIQNSLLEKLRNAAFDDEVIDFTVLTDESDINRNKIKTALFDLYQRLYQSSRMDKIPEPLLPTTATLALTSRRSIPAEKPRVQYTVPPDSSCAHGGVRYTSEKQFHKRKWLLSKVRGSSKSQTQPDRKASTNNVGSEVALVSRPTVSSTSSRQSIYAKIFTYEAGEDDPFQIWGDDDDDEDSEDQLACYRSSAPNYTQATPRSIEMNAQVTPLSKSPDCQIPTSENDFLGLCDASWKLQCGDRKTLKKTKWAQSSRFTEEYFFCTSCAYYCRMHEDHLWNKVWILAPQGVKFRWSFLAKSHAPQKKRAKSSNFSYLCLFCVYTDIESQPRSLEALFEHISSEHRNANMGDAVLSRTNCITERICRDEEEFDINLWPLGPSDKSNIRKESPVSTVSGSSKSTGPVWEKIVRQVVDASGNSIS